MNEEGAVSGKGVGKDFQAEFSGESGVEGEG